MAKISAGILLYSFDDYEKLKVFLVHPGGPYFVNKDSWGIPKGEVDGENGEDGKNLLNVALREFGEETGIRINKNEKFIFLGDLKRKDGKKVYAWALRGTGKEKFLKSNYFEMEWPAGSGEIQKFPEVDGGRYFLIDVARRKIHKYQREFLDRLEEVVGKEIREGNKGKMEKKEKQRGLF